MRLSRRLFQSRPPTPTHFVAFSNADTAPFAREAVDPARTVSNFVSFRSTLLQHRASSSVSKPVEDMQTGQASVLPHSPTNAQVSVGNRRLKMLEDIKGFVITDELFWDVWSWNADSGNVLLCCDMLAVAAEHRRGPMPTALLNKVGPCIFGHVTRYAPESAHSGFAASEAKYSKEIRLTGARSQFAHRNLSARAWASLVGLGVRPEDGASSDSVEFLNRFLRQHLPVASRRGAVSAPVVERIRTALNELVDAVASLMMHAIQCATEMMSIRWLEECLAWYHSVFGNPLTSDGLGSGDAPHAACWVSVLRFSPESISEFADIFRQKQASVVSMLFYGLHLTRCRAALAMQSPALRATEVFFTASSDQLINAYSNRLLKLLSSHKSPSHNKSEAIADVGDAVAYAHLVLQRHLVRGVSLVTLLAPSVTTRFSKEELEALDVTIQSAVSVADNAGGFQSLLQSCADRNDRTAFDSTLNTIVEHIALNSAIAHDDKLSLLKDLMSPWLCVNRDRNSVALLTFSAIAHSLRILCRSSDVRHSNFGDMLVEELLTRDEVVHSDVYSVACELILVQSSKHEQGHCTSSDSESAIIRILGKLTQCGAKDDSGKTSSNMLTSETIRLEMWRGLFEASRKKGWINLAVQLRALRHTLFF